MVDTILTYPRYRDQVLGLWLGKFIGGTAGAPVEGLKGTHAFTPAQVVPTTLVENDDTDLQLLWLHALEEHGPRLGAEQLAREWREHVDAPWCEYGYACRNLAEGVPPPRSGRHNNWFFGENMGCPIRSEIWGAVCPGAPAEAARLAGLDASLDHFGAAVDAERFLAAVEAALFTESDLRRLIVRGLEHVTPDGRFARLIADVLDWQRRLPWRTVRERIIQVHGDPCSLHALPNLGFTVLALLEGQGDLTATVALAINAGWDTDCTAATAGAIIGGLAGASGLPAALRAAVPDTYAISPWMLGFPRSGGLDRLTDATCAMALRVASELGTGVRIDGAPAGLAPAPLAVVPQPARLTAPKPTGQARWRIAGPFWRGWDERRKAEGDHGASPAATCLPSLAYMTHMQSGIELDQLAPARLFDPADDLGGAPAWERRAEDDRLPLADLGLADIPGSLYAATSVRCAAEHPVWLMAGSTGPLRLWLNGVEVITSASYQPLTPTTFGIQVRLRAGENRIVVKVGRTSQPYGACLAFKADTGKHWHQEFFDSDLAW
ncbi:MAG: ADP-ribosylglycohydrolase family protein [Planctomycetes bacterium]|nr:ADP-ribosylglycohydrolase family protein [Planctomycetota bacterium]